MLTVVALPAWAENPPRPDGLVYLILIIPLLAVAARVAGAQLPRRGWVWRIGFALVFAVLVLLAATGTGLGALAALVIVVYGLLRAVRIARAGSGGRRFAGAAVAVVGSLLVATGYMWALAGGSAYERNRANQSRTMADMRSIGTAVLMWSEDQRTAGGGAAAGDAVSATVSATPAPTIAEGGPLTTVSFGDGAEPPPVSVAELAALLVPDYIRVMPEADGWKQPFDIRFDRDTHALLIRSGGKDRDFDGDTYTRGPYDRWEWHRDIVWVDGEFFSWPEQRPR
jgi:hypothetical protein